MEVFTYEIQKSIPKKAAHKYTNKTYFLKETLSFAHIFYIAFSQSFIHFQQLRSTKKANTTLVFKTGEFIRGFLAFYVTHQNMNDVYLIK